MSPVVHVNKSVSAAEFCALMESVGWGAAYPEGAVHRSIEAYPFIAHARSTSGELVGYVSAFSDVAFSTMLGELAVHPKAQGQGVGRALLMAVERAYPGVPVYVKPLGAQARAFFLACGYQAPAVTMQVLYKRASSLPSR